MKKTVAAYVMDRSAEQLRVSDLSKLDIIYYAFSTLKDGKPGLYGLRNIDLMSKLKKCNPALQVVVSIGGWGAGGFSGAAATAEGRAAFTRAAMEYIRAYDFDGIDMDWEYPCAGDAGIDFHPDDKYHFTALLENLRQALDEHGRTVGHGMQLSAAVGTGPARVTGIEAEKVGRLLDRVNLMTYDIRGYSWGLAGHHTNLFPQTGAEDSMCADLAVRQYAEAGVPVEKMVLGAAFYGHVFNGVTGFNQKAPRGGTMTFTEIDRRYLHTDGGPAAYKRYWDAQARAPYLFNGQDLISYDDEESLTHKCRYVKEKNLAGIMFWEYGGDQTYRLLNAIRL